MKLVFVFNVLYTNSIGGVERNLLDFLGAVDAPDFECAVITLRGPGPFNDRLTSAGVDNFTPAGSEVAKARCLARFLRQWRPNIVHLYGLKANLLGRPLGRLYGCSVVSSIVGADPGRSWQRVALDRSTARLVDQWIANSQAGKALECRRLGIPPGQITVIYGGIDTLHFAPTEDRIAAKEGLGISSSTKVVVTVANLRPMKGHAALVRVSQRVVDRVGDTVFLFVGEDGMGGAIQDEARERGVDPFIRFLGGQADVRPYLAAADVFALPSMHEGLPTSILEAMSMQLPVVASGVGGIPEILEHQENGFIIRPDDESVLEDTLVDILTDASLRDRLGANARRRALGQFSLERMVRDLTGEYRRIAESHPKRRARPLLQREADSER
jgi:glycosyltransferase involved in cell wall biosynthesis